MEEFIACFEGLKDPRAANAWHDLHELLMIALCSALCGAESCVDMAEFAAAKEPLLRQFLELKHGPPSHDTFSRLFRALDPDRFNACFGCFVERFFEQHQGVIAIDGKTLRRSFDRAAGTSPLHLVGAFAVELGLVLGQVAVDAKSNEIVAVPKLLRMLSLEGRIVTLDAMNCQRTIAATIIDQGADYVLALKNNHPALLDDVRTFLDDAATVCDVATHVDGGHGRVEIRQATVATDIAWLTEAHPWPGLAAVAKVASVREVDGQPTRQDRYFLLSRCFPAAELVRIVRSHWQIENGLHWSLDVVMHEDNSRVRKDNGPLNLAVLRRMALNLVRRNPDKGSLRGKFKRAGWNDAFFFKLLAPNQMR